MTIDRVSFDGWPIHPDYQKEPIKVVSPEDKGKKVEETKK